jgi:hypothetical protein
MALVCAELGDEIWCAAGCKLAGSQFTFQVLPFDEKLTFLAYMPLLLLVIFIIIFTAQS